MSGILDSKTRVMDTVLTLEGRKRLSEGDMNISYVTFTDSSTFYLPDPVSGSADATVRLYLEASSLPQDMISFRADDSGRLMPYSNSSMTLNTGSMSYGQVLIGSGSILSGSSFASESEKVLGYVVDNFTNQQIIGTRDAYKDQSNNEFKLSRTTDTFTVSDSSPLVLRSQQVVDIKDYESIFYDPRFSRLPNFKFLPPLRRKLKIENFVPHTTVDDKNNRHTGTRTSAQKLNDLSSRLDEVNVLTIKNDTLLGNYRPIGSIESVTDQQIESGLRYFESKGLKTVVGFDVRPTDNTILCQVFESSDGQLLKLDVVNFGTVMFSDGHTGRTYFVGKMVTDSNDTHTFIHLFTVIFESKTR